MNEAGETVGSSNDDRNEYRKRTFLMTDVLLTGWKYNKLSSRTREMESKQTNGPCPRERKLLDVEMSQR